MIKNTQHYSRRQSKAIPAIAAIVLLLFSPVSQAATYYVETKGKDDGQRDGKSTVAAWASLAFTCKQVPKGKHTIKIGAGTFIVTETARPQSGLTIVGSGRSGDQATNLIASTKWKLSEDPKKGDASGEFIIAMRDQEDITIRNIAFASKPEHRITGAIFVRGGKHVTIEHLKVDDFRWSAIRLEHASHLDVHHLDITNGSTDKINWHGGCISTRWIKHSTIHHNRVVNHIGGGYGYKAGGHEGVRIHHNVFDIKGGFAIESAHENEYGVEIDHNFANHCISIPKGRQADDPNKRGYKYSFWIHDNFLTHSYTIEGPRNHLKFNNNYVRVEHTNGRIYTHHGGINEGPIWIHHNVVENVDRAFIWMNQGYAANIFVYNNTVFCARAGKRSGMLIDSWSAERHKNWVIKNNVFVAPMDEPRKLYRVERDVPKHTTIKNNLCINFTNVPEGNFTGEDPGFKGEGAKPWPYYTPASAKSFIVDRGLDVGFPFEGKMADLGAAELGEKKNLADLPTPPRSSEPK